MLRLYFGGSYASPLEVPELTNEDGTHKRLGGDAYNKFMRNEGLRFLDKDVPTDTEKNIDLALTALGPIMVSWSGGLHVSLVVAVIGGDLYHHDPAEGPNRKMPVNLFNIYRTGGGGVMGGMLVRDPNANQWVRYETEFSRSTDGVTKKDGWPTGWWRVSDGGSTWYYYLGNGRIVMSSKTAPSSLGPPARPHNSGTWVFKDPSTLVITWNKVAGASMACVETFWNASRECERMNANSNLYAPLAATRFRTK